VLLLHESGHLLAGLAVGMRIREVVVGPVCVFPRAGTLGVRFLNPMIWHSGHVLFAPTESQDLRRRVLIVVSCGLLARLVGCVLCLVLAYLCNEAAASTGPPRPGTFWIRMLIPRTHASIWLSVLAALNLLVVLTSLIPTEGRTIPSDGAQLLDLL